MHDTSDKTTEQPNVQQPDNNLEAKVQEWKDRALRVSAEFENYKKRQERDRQQFDYFAQRQLILPLLQVVDNLERFTKQMSEVPEALKGWTHGIDLVIKDFEKYLTSVGLQRINHVQTFDPELHEAIMQVESDQPSGTIVEVLEPGYQFKNNILRPAKVSVAA